MPINPSVDESSIVRRGAVAVIVRDSRLLIIRRSQLVLAPGLFCFPGGGIEPGETEQQALVRELLEELGCTVTPLERLWEYISSWRVHLSWWLADLEELVTPEPNPAEVESFHWFTLEELATLPDQLESNLRFVEAVRRGEVKLPI
jgi:8-oxo-dGTP diphosphatase